MINLGTLQGDTSSSGSGINHLDHVVGESRGANATRAFLDRDGVMRDLGTLGGTSSTAAAINNAVQIVGSAQDAAGVWRAFIYENASMKDLGTLAGKESRAYGINQRGQVVGVFDTGEVRRVGFGAFAPVFHAFLYENGQITDLTALVPNVVEARGSNERGQIVGTATVTMKVYRALS